MIQTRFDESFVFSEHVMKTLNDNIKIKNKIRIKTINKTFSKICLNIYHYDINTTNNDINNYEEFMSKLKAHHIYNCVNDDKKKLKTDYDYNDTSVLIKDYLNKM